MQKSNATAGTATSEVPVQAAGNGGAAEHAGGGSAPHGLDPLFERARHERLWFWCRYQDLWFSPDELAAYQRDGRFRWGAENWTLRDPHERLAALREKTAQSLRDIEAFVKRMGA